MVAYYFLSRTHRQRGMALIVALILLLTMTLLGVTAMRSTTQGERMAGNFRDRNLAFQAAEAALREGENILRNDPPPLSMVIGAVQGPSDPVSYDNLGWNTAELYDGTLQGLSAQPRYFIELVRLEGDSEEFSDDQGVYRVTARGLGGTTDAVVILQITVRRGVIGG